MFYVFRRLEHSDADTGSDVYVIWRCFFVGINPNDIKLNKALHILLLTFPECYSLHENSIKYHSSLWVHNDKTEM